MRINSNRMARSWRVFCTLVALGSLLMGPGGGFQLWAGGGLLIGGPNLSAFGASNSVGAPVVWSTAAPVDYRVDGGPLSAQADGTVVVDQAAGVARVDGMFQVWADVPTAAISFTNGGGIDSVGAFTDGDVDTMDEFNAVEGDCNAGIQSPIIFDADGTVFDALGKDPLVIGFAGPCNAFSIDSGNGVVLIAAGRAALNGKFIDGDTGNNELSPDRFDGAFIHEFGHMIGMDHSQINLNCFTGFCAGGSDDAFGLPTMFPVALSVNEGAEAAQKTLSPDDIAWLSKMYPDATFAGIYGTITGTIFFSDGISHAQGVNVIARQVDDPLTVGVDESRRNAVSMVSGAWFTPFPGQAVTGESFGADGNADFGGSDSDLTLVGFYSIPVLPGNYTVEAEGVNAAFDEGSGLNPLNPPVPMPGGTPEFYSGASESNADDPRTAPTDTVNVTVTAGITTANIDIILNGTDPRFDQFESARILAAPAWRVNLFLWIREEGWRLPEPGETA